MHHFEEDCNHSAIHEQLLSMFCQTLQVRLPGAKQDCDLGKEAASSGAALQPKLSAVMFGTAFIPMRFCSFDTVCSFGLDTGQRTGKPAKLPMSIKMGLRVFPTQFTALACNPPQERGRANVVFVKPACRLCELLSVTWSKAASSEAELQAAKHLSVCVCIC